MTTQLTEIEEARIDDEVASAASTRPESLKVALISLHGLIRGRDPELGRDADTGGQVKYVLELARELAAQPNVRQVELLTRQIIDPRVDNDYAQLAEPLSEKASPKPAPAARLSRPISSISANVSSQASANGSAALGSRGETPLAVSG